MHIKKDLFMLQERWFEDIRHIIPLLLVICYLPVMAQDSTRYDEIYDQLINMGDENIVMSNVSNYTIHRSAAKFNLNEGNLYLLGPVDGREIAAVFKGKGQFWFSPSNQIEQDQLFRFFETDTLIQEFNYLFLIFSDSTAKELRATYEFSSNFDPDEIDNMEAEIEDVFEYIADDEHRYFRTDILKFLLDKEINEYFYAHFFEDKLQPLMYEINPYEQEQIRLMQRAELGHIYKIPEVICQFQKDQSSESNYSQDFWIKKYIIETTIRSNLDFIVQAKLHIQINRDGQKWLPFNIYYDMVIDSVTSGTGLNLNFFKPEETLVFWVENDQILNRGDTLNLILNYHCDDILHSDSRSWVYLKAPNYWYPRNSLWDLAEYELIFNYPEDLTLVSIGEKVFSQKNDDTVKAIWRPKDEVTHASFNLGYFESLKIENDSLPDGITILKTKQGLMFRTGDIEEEVAEDIDQSLKFYAEKYGEIPFDGLYVSEIPFPHGVAYKGLINLSWGTFYQTGFGGYDQVFRAHEVAHQWWGIGVGFKSYHDQWLSESFSEFSGIWYLQQLKDGIEQFEDMMDVWHELIINNRNYMFSTGQESGPIWLGVRTSSSQTAGDYNLIVYKKGAWVLHMLRMMLYDWNKKDDTKFTHMMQDFYFTYRGKKATTTDFKNIVEKHFEKPMDWFFDQWIYGTEIPKYYYAVQTSESDDGTYRLEITAIQDEEQELFHMPIPVGVVYEDDRREYFVLDMNQKVNRMEYVMQSEPDEIIFNSYHAVLAEIEEVDMDEFDQE